MTQRTAATMLLWQPWATAPKDRQILVRHPDCPIVVQWHQNYDPEWDAEGGWSYAEEGLSEWDAPEFGAGDHWCDFPPPAAF